MKEQVKALWKLCFPDDTDDFVELYFSSRYNDEINSAIVEDGMVVSALQRIPYPMQYIDKVIPVAYISGACTHPEFRSRGLMSRLLDDAHRKMYADGKYLSLLIPANEGLVAYYAKSGYEVTFQQKTKLLTGMCKTVDNSRSGLIFRELELLGKDYYDVSDFVNRQLLTFSASVLHTLQDIKIILSDLHLSGGQAWCAYTESGNICAVVFLVAAYNNVVIKELLATDKQTETAMIDFVLNHYSISHAEKPSPCGMSRVINACRMLEIVASVMDGRHIVEIYGDDVITENNGLYIIEGGACRRLYTHVSNTNSVHRIHINSLSSWLFHDMKPYMSLMLD